MSPSSLRLEAGNAAPLFSTSLGTTPIGVRREVNELGPAVDASSADAVTPAGGEIEPPPAAPHN